MTGAVQPPPLPPARQQKLLRLFNTRRDLLDAQAEIKEHLAEIDKEILPLLKEAGDRFEPFPGQGVRVNRTARFKAAKLPTYMGEQYKNVCIFPPSNKTDALKCIDPAIVSLCMEQSEESVTGIR